MQCSRERTVGGLEETLGQSLWERDVIPASLEPHGLGTERWER